MDQASEVTPPTPPTLPRALPVIINCSEATDLFKLEEGLCKSLADYISQSRGRRPAVIGIQIWMHCKTTIFEKGVPVMKTVFKDTVKEQTAFAISPTILVTTRHGFTTPQFDQVEWEDDFANTKDAKASPRMAWLTGTWEYHGVCSTTTNKPIMEYIPIRRIYHSFDITFLMATDIRFIHHVLAMVPTDVNRTVFVPDISKLPVMLWKGSIDFFSGWVGMHGFTTCTLRKGFSGSPILTATGEVLGMVYSSQTLRCGARYTIFYGSNFLRELSAHFFGQQFLLHTKHTQQQFPSLELQIKLHSLPPGNEVFPYHKEDDNEDATDTLTKFRQAAASRSKLMERSPNSGFHSPKTLGDLVGDRGFKREFNRIGRLPCTIGGDQKSEQPSGQFRDAGI